MFRQVCEGFEEERKMMEVYPEDLGAQDTHLNCYIYHRCKNNDYYACVLEASNHTHEIPANQNHVSSNVA